MKLTEHLNKTLADLHQMLMLTYQIHWFMRGERFLVLHPMLDDYIEEYQDAIDEVAEKNIILGGTPLSTLDEIVKASTMNVTPGSYNLSINEQLEKLIAGLKHLDSVLVEGIEIAEAANKQDVVDMYADLQASTEKHLWMLNAELGRSARA